MIGNMERREFLRTSAAALLAGSGRLSWADAASDAPVFSTANRRWQRAYDQALQVLAGNVQVMPHYDAPVLIEGANYAGIWQECGPLEALVYRPFRSDVPCSGRMDRFQRITSARRRALDKFRWLCPSQPLPGNWPAARGTTSCCERHMRAARVGIAG